MCVCACVCVCVCVRARVYIHIMYVHENKQVDSKLRDKLRAVVSAHDDSLVAQVLSLTYHYTHV